MNDYLQKALELIDQRLQGVDMDVKEILRTQATKDDIEKLEKRIAPMEKKFASYVVVENTAKVIFGALVLTIIGWGFSTFGHNAASAQPQPTPAPITLHIH